MDEIDVKVLEILKRNARSKYVKVAQAVGLTEGAVRRRIKELTKQGVIRRFTIETTVELEGIVLVIFGFLLLLGRGGINLWDIRAAILGSAADALYGRRRRRAPGPSEIMRRDTWKASGFVRFGLILIFAGIILIVLYLL